MKHLVIFTILMLSACQSTETDTSMLGANEAQLHARMQTTCMATQEKLTGGTYDTLWPACECYATTTLKTLDAAEKDHLRNTSVFNDGAKDKALNALDFCRLKRP